MWSDMGKNNTTFRKHTKVAFKRLCGPTAIGGLNIPKAYTLNKGLIMNKQTSYLRKYKAPKMETHLKMTYTTHTSMR